MWFNWKEEEKEIYKLFFIHENERFQCVLKKKRKINKKLIWKNVAVCAKCFDFFGYTFCLWIFQYFDKTKWNEKIDG
jgi:hypothetical protein